MSAPSMLGLTIEERERFIRAVEKAEKFTDLGIEEQFMILRAEREIELLKNNGSKNTDRSVRFRWEKGEVIGEMSQCAYCKNALDYATCAEFGTKPKKYRHNEEPCPKRITEK